MEIETAGRGPEAPTRKEWLLVLLLSVLLAGALTALAATQYRFTGDTEHYVTLARDIATGTPYEVNGRPEMRFPPGFPLLLAPAALLARGSFAAITRWAALLASSVFLLTWLYVRRREPRFALPIAVLTAVCMPFLNLAAGNPMSEPIYLAFTLALLLWADRWYGGGRAKRSWGWLALGGLLLIALPAIRTIGVAAVAAAGMMFVAEALQRDPGSPRGRLRDALPFVAGAGFVLAWLLWTRAHAVGWYGVADRGYLNDLLQSNPHHPDLGRATGMQLLERMVNNFLIQAAHAVELLTPVSWMKPGWVSPAMLVVPVVIAGWWQELRAGDRFGALYFLCYMGILLLWPYDEGARFLLPAVPLLWIYLLGGLRQLDQLIRLRPGRVRVIAILWCAAAAITLAIALPVTPLEYSRQVTAAFLLWILLFLAVSVGWNLLVRRVHGWGPSQTRRLVAVAVPLLVIGSLAQMGPLMLQRARGVPDPSENSTALREASEWIKANTPAQAVIQTTYTTRISFATDRATVPLPRTRAPERFLDIERRYHPDYLLILESNDRFYVPSDEARFTILAGLFPNRWQLVHQVTKGRIYAFR
jgi:hypothetical protein